MSRPVRNRPSTWSPWLRTVHDAYACAAQAWALAAEEASNGWSAELVDFRAEHPHPLFRDFLVSAARPA